MEILRNQEEADTRLTLHVFDVCRKGYKKLTILCSDTEIAVFALYHLYGLDVNELWMEYGVGHHKRWHKRWLVSESAQKVATNT